MKVLATEAEKKRAKDYYQKNKQRILERSRNYCPKYYQENREKILEKKRMRYPKYREAILERQKEYAKTHREQRQKYQLGYRESHYFKIKMEVLSHYSEGRFTCVRCGFNDLRALSIDHINGGGNKHRKEEGYGSNFYGWLIKNKFPDGFRTLCMNCQWITRQERSGKDAGVLVMLG